jgi:hypothetical protein
VTDVPTEASVKEVDPIDAELERALFKRFWGWLAIVGTVVIVVVSGFSVIASQFVSSIIDNRVEVAIEKINGLEKRSLESIDRIETRALDSAINTANAQAKSVIAAESAQAAVATLQSKINSLPKVDDLLKNNDAIVAGLASNKDFADRLVSTQDRSFSRLLSWDKSEPATSERVGGAGGPFKSLCPDGYYAVGVLVYGNVAGPSCIGCLNGAQLMCRKLNVDQAGGR